MKINDDHMFHGAALIQIAECCDSTILRPFIFKGKTSRCAFWVNKKAAVYLKYRSNPESQFEQYSFLFTQRNLSELTTLNKQAGSVYLGLICVGDREICCLSYEQFRDLIKARKTAVGGMEDEYRILVCLPSRSKFRVWIDCPGTKGRFLSELKIARSAFPSYVQ